MPITLAVRFPLGRYHATPWDRSVNEGAAEWPPSPWRLLRALIATWYARWPDLPAAEFDELLDGLGVLPSYLAPPAGHGHTRHYLPNLDYKQGLPDTKKQRPKPDENDPSGRELTLDPFLSVPKGEPLLIRWETSLKPRQRTALAKLAELLPYLGRAESVCEARLLDENPEPDESWWRPGAESAWAVRLLAPSPPVRRETLEVTTVGVRKMRRTQPPGTRWVSYGRERQEDLNPARRDRGTGRVEAVRLAVLSRAPVRLSNGILLADAVHRAASRVFPDDVSGHVLGYRGARTDHRHAHWIPLPGGEADQHDCVLSLVVFVPHGLATGDVSRLLRIRHVSGRVGAAGREASRYEFRGLPKVDLLLQAAGPLRQVAPELCGPARRWVSLTPYLPVRHWHRKRETPAGYLRADVNAELAYRGLPPAAASPSAPGRGLIDDWARGFRRYRMNEHLGKARPGLGIVLTFSDEVPGPLLLGQLSHFGYGVFVPESHD